MSQNFLQLHESKSEVPLFGPPNLTDNLKNNQSYHSVSNTPPIIMVYFLIQDSALTHISLKLYSHVLSESQALQKFKVFFLKLTLK